MGIYDRNSILWWAAHSEYQKHEVQRECQRLGLGNREDSWMVSAPVFTEFQKPACVNIPK